VPPVERASAIAEAAPDAAAALGPWSLEASALASGKTAEESEKIEAPDGSGCGASRPPPLDWLLVLRAGEGCCGCCCCCCWSPRGSAVACELLHRGVTRLDGLPHPADAALLRGEASAAHAHAPPSSEQQGAAGADAIPTSCASWELGTPCGRLALLLPRQALPCPASALPSAASRSGGGRYSTRSTSALTDQRLADTTLASTMHPSRLPLPSGASAGTSTCTQGVPRHASQAAQATL
jgi:hypothetical protein